VRVKVVMALEQFADEQVFEALSCVTRMMTCASRRHVL
jgi:hypothetical protein